MSKEKPITIAVYKHGAFGGRLIDRKPSRNSGAEGRREPIVFWRKKGTTPAQKHFFRTRGKVITRNQKPDRGLLKGKRGGEHPTYNEGEILSRGQIHTFVRGHRRPNALMSGRLLRSPRLEDVKPTG